MAVLKERVVRDLGVLGILGVLLMLGEVDRTVAATIGRMLAAIVRASWRDPESERVFGDQSVFDQLRIDPYYRTTAARHLELKPYFDRLMRDSGARRVSLVHGDCWLVWMASHPQST